MADRHQELARAAEHVAPVWTPSREHRVRARLEETQAKGVRKQRALVIAFAAVVAGALAVFGVRAVFPGSVGERSAHEAPASAPALVRFEDGTVATGLGDDARVAPVEVGAHAVAVRLENGGARFSVAPNPERTFRVMAKDVTVTVLGTVFSVVMEPSGVHVSVERGHVRVAWPSGERDLVAGQDTLVKSDVAAPAVPASVPAPAAQEPEPVVPTDEPKVPAHATPEHARGAAVTPPSAPSWRALAEEGDYAHALARLTADGPSSVRDDPEDLLLAADVARLGGNPTKALGWLERIVSAHASDSRAPLAAFTLGRTLLDQLGRPREAAQAFATAQRLAPKGALTQDALAREVESWSRAGDAALARDRAERYSTLYPKGRRLQAVRRLGGLE